MRQRYARFVALSNKGARELGFADAGALWRSNYDMPPEKFAAEVDRLWAQVRPLYLALHAFVRTKLGEQYGTKLVSPNGLIPAHLLGNMWAQDWSNVYDLVAPKNTTSPGYDVTERLKRKMIEPLEMFKIGERFFTSLGLPNLPKTFWERSLFVKPRDREVVCHASAWVIDNKSDVRIKMCTEPTGEDFSTIHHELGHDYYYLAYQKQPFLFMSGANDGFHEAIGDAIALSITPDYLRTIQLLDEVPSSAADTMLLLRQALDTVAFLPLGLLIDQWRWRVFSGAVKPKEYNKAWWELRAKYQGVAPPLARNESDFDPGAKYHVPANTPYARYFLAAILQLQFYRALCHDAGWKGALYRCTVYGNKEAGKKLWEMLSLGASKPWPEALYVLTGQREMDAGAMLEYFAPLMKWLEEQNQGKKVGW
jgi:peptidyl-dipeptidase A